MKNEKTKKERSAFKRGLFLVVFCIKLTKRKKANMKKLLGFSSKNEAKKVKEPKERKHLSLSEYQQLEKEQFANRRKVPKKDVCSALLVLLGFSDPLVYISEGLRTMSSIRRNKKEWDRSDLASFALGLVAVDFGTFIVEFDADLVKELKEMVEGAPAVVYDADMRRFPSNYTEVTLHPAPARGGPSTPTPFLLVEPISDCSSSSSCSIDVKALDATAFSGCVGDFQVWRWCTTDAFRQFIPLVPIDLSEANEVKMPATVSTAAQRVTLLEVGNVSLEWMSFSHTSPLICLEIDRNWIFYTMPPERASSIVPGHIGRVEGTNRFLWVDLPLASNTPEKKKEENGFPGHSDIALFANKDVALLVARKLDARSLCQFARCCKTTNVAVEKARREFVERCVFDKRMIDSEVPLSQLLRAHGSEKYVRVSATYHAQETIGSEQGKGEAAMFVDCIIMEVRMGDERVVRWVRMPKEVQLPISRPMFID